jgi:hypothetical protein
MSEHIAIEKLNGEPVALHYLTLPSFTDKGAYSAIRAFEAFKNAMHRWFARHMYVDKNDASKGFYFNREIPGQYFSIQWADDFAITSKCSGDYYDRLPKRQWSSIYDFLDAVKYDRKKRKLESWSELKGKR